MYDVFCDIPVYI